MSTTVFEPGSPVASEEDILEQGSRLEALLPELMRRLFTLDREHPVADMPLGQLRVCSILQSGPQTLTHLSERLGISSSAMTQIADRLVRAGYVERTHEVDDRRVRRLKLSGLGEQTMGERRRMRAERAVQALCHLSTGQRAGIIEAVETLAEAALCIAPTAAHEDPTGARLEQ